ncbi:MAG TPA: TIM-barrel domain-containing protein [Armatimonadota bacterium]|jgi:hypothetical protein
MVPPEITGQGDRSLLVMRTASQEIVCDTIAQQLSLTDTMTGQVLFASPVLSLCAPVLNGIPITLTFVAAQQTADGTLTLQFTAPELTAFTLHLTPDVEADSIDISCDFTVHAATQLNRLDLFPARTLVTPYDVVNYRNRHHTPNTYPELVLGDACETDTYSGDWQFTPHPTLFILRKLSASLFVGALDLPQAFGMYLSVKQHRVRHWYLDYGAAADGQPLAAGERFVSPRFRLFVRHGLSVNAMLDSFAAMLIAQGLIPHPLHKARQAWWQEPLYCTWIDQCMAVNARVPGDLHEQALAPSIDAYGACTEELVRKAVEIIKRERLPFRTILLDEGWEVTRGQWEPEPSHFPDLRALVDDLHADGFKVVVWWNWAEINDTAEVNPTHLIAGGKRNRHGKRVRDYSSPVTQEEYLKPLFHQLFSSDPGCYHLDGVKTDFLADKVHADMPLFDPTWRGEENYIRHITELFYREMKRHKPDAVHIGCAGHFWLAEWIDINRTYDVASSNYLEHEERAQMLLHTTPGCPVAYDFHNELENLEGYFASARKLGASTQIGNLLYVKDTPFAEPRPADAAYYELLRREFAAMGWKR